jgi:tRNA 2-thiouridine synthesizing protein D
MTHQDATHFTLMVSRGPFEHRNAENALAFCYGAVSQGHTISQVFFYQSGVHNASALLTPHNDDIKLYEKWCALHSELGIRLNVCVSAASRRGVVDEQLASRPELANLVYPFEQVGLSAYFESLLSGSVNIQL